MSASPYRLSRKSDFTRTLRAGVRVSRRDVVVHLYRPDADKLAANPKSVASQGGPRFGFIVSKAVGNAVTRHAVTRKLRVACREVIVAGAVPSSTTVVVRAHGSAATATTASLGEQVRVGVERANERLGHDR